MRSFYRYSVSPARGGILRAAAYIAAARFQSRVTGEIFDYRSRAAGTRDEVIFAVLLTPSQGAADEVRFWESVAAKNRHPRAVHGRTIVAALPACLTQVEMAQRAAAYARSLMERYRVAVHYAIHTPRGYRADEQITNGFDGLPDQPTNDNWHVHFLLSYCVVNVDGTLGPKQRMIDPITARCDGLPNFCEVERPLWQEEMNAALAEAGHTTTVDHRSLKDQGSPDEPTVPLGPQRWALEQSGISTDLGRHNEAIRQRNAARRRQLAELHRLEDARRVIEAARPFEPRLPFARSRKFPWDRRFLSRDAAASLLYFQRRFGIVATRDGGRLVEYGRDTIIVNIGKADEIIRLIAERAAATPSLQWRLLGHSALLERVESSLSTHAIEVIRSGKSSLLLTSPNSISHHQTNQAQSEPLRRLIPAQIPDVPATGFSLEDDSFKEF